jgi:hypothetical protein
MRNQLSRWQGRPILRAPPLHPYPSTVLPAHHPGHPVQNKRLLANRKVQATEHLEGRVHLKEARLRAGVNALGPASRVYIAVPVPRWGKGRVHSNPPVGWTSSVSSGVQGNCHGDRRIGRYVNRSILAVCANGECRCSVGRHLPDVDKAVPPLISRVAIHLDEVEIAVSGIREDSVVGRGTVLEVDAEACGLVLLVKNIPHRRYLSNNSLTFCARL